MFVANPGDTLFTITKTSALRNFFGGPDVAGRRVFHGKVQLIYRKMTGLDVLFETRTSDRPFRGESTMNQPPGIATIIGSYDNLPFQVRTFSASGAEQKGAFMLEGVQVRFEKRSDSSISYSLAQNESDKFSSDIRFLSNSELAEAPVANVLKEPSQSAPESTVNIPSLERDRLTAEVEAERKKRQELDAQRLAEIEAERKKRLELEAQLAEAKEKERQLAEGKERERQQAQTPLPQPQAAIRNERRVALLVGNGAYKQSPLTNSVNDAVDLNASLKNLGFQTLLVQNASLATMRQKTREFADLALNADVALIFFSGHGIEYRGNNYLIPTSAGSLKEFEVEDETFNVARWMDMLETQKGANMQRVNIVILDACRDNAFSRGWRNTNRGLARMDAPSGTILAYATAPGKLASDGSAGDRNSPYTKNLLRAIQQPNVPVEQVFKDVRRMVVEQTKGEQVPWENSSLIGNFVFKR